MSNPQPKVAWVYLRISTDRQEVDNQKQQIAKFAESHDYWIPEDRWYIDEAVHGTLAAIERQQFRRLHDDLADMNLRGIELPKHTLMYEVSRLGRTFWETLEAIKFLEDLAPIMSSSPKEAFLQIEDRSMRHLFLAVLAWAAERELENLKQRVTDGVKRAHSEGKHSGNKFLGYYQWSHLEDCNSQDHGFGSAEKNEKFCPLRGKIFSDELGRRAVGLYEANPKITAKLLSVALKDILPGENEKQKYKAAWNLLNNVKELGLLVEPDKQTS